MGDQTTASEEAVTEAPPPASPEAAASDWAKVYVGNLPNDLEEDGLRSLLSEKSLPEAETVLVKRGGYAFLEFSEQIKADEVISLMDGRFPIFCLLFSLVCVLCHLTRKFCFRFANKWTHNKGRDVDGFGQEKPNINLQGCVDECVFGRHERRS